MTSSWPSHCFDQTKCKKSQRWPQVDGVRACLVNRTMASLFKSRLSHLEKKFFVGPVFKIIAKPWQVPVCRASSTSTLECVVESWSPPCQPPRGGFATNPLLARSPPPFPCGCTLPKEFSWFLHLNALFVFAQLVLIAFSALRIMFVASLSSCCARNLTSWSTKGQLPET